MPFSEIRGHRRQLNRLRTILKSGRLGQAYLFSGPSGIGKRAVALGLLSSLYCERLEHDFCGLCNPCKLVLGEGHPDVHRVKPEEGKKETTIDQVRDLEHAFLLRSFYGKKKAALIEESDTLNWPAQNALLKTLEEPRGDALLILLASRPGSLLPTVLSRCHEVSFQPLAAEDVLAILLKNGYDEGQASLLSRLCQGSVGKAVELHEGGYLEMRTEILRLLETGRRDRAQVLDWVESVSADGVKTDTVLDLLEASIRDAIVLKHAPSGLDLMNPDLKVELETIQGTWSVGALLDLFDGVLQLRSALDHNAQKELAVEATLLPGFWGATLPESPLPRSI